MKTMKKMTSNVMPVWRINMDFNREYKERINLIDNYISDYLNSTYEISSPVLSEAMRYSVLNGGKRLRSVLCIEISKMLGGALEKALPFACAIELIHAYSLVHDDLPSMDNSDTRRGMPSCHKKYGEALGILCGDALLNSAYELMASCCEDTSCAKSMKLIASSAGALGMIDGQVIDLDLGSKKLCNVKDLIKLIELKTMALIKASVLSGATLAQCSDDVLFDMNNFAYHLGLAFQIRDDFEDIAEDASNEGDSPNFINFLGYDEAKKLLDKHANMAKEIISKYENSEFLSSLLSFLFED